MAVGVERSTISKMLVKNHNEAEVKSPAAEIEALQRRLEDGKAVADSYPGRAFYSEIND